MLLTVKNPCSGLTSHFYFLLELQFCILNFKIYYSGYSILPINLIIQRIQILVYRLNQLLIFEVCPLRHIH